MNPTQQAAYAAARTLRSTFVGDNGYGLVYGSHPAGAASPRSDLDLVLISPHRLTDSELSQLIDAVCHLHRVHGFDLDTEVDYAVKLHASFADVDAAVSLRCFDFDGNGQLTVPAVVVEPWFLNSRTFARRLLLNSLTSPHVFLGGDTTIYTEHRNRAEHALALLAVARVRHSAPITLDEAITAITIGPQTSTRKDFLGYTRSQHLRTTLLRGLMRLTEDGILRHLDGNTFQPDHRACQATIKQLQARGVGQRGDDQANITRRSSVTVPRPPDRQ